MTYKKQAGFTLLEVLLVVAIIAILAGIVIFALNPSKQLGDTRNAQRRADINTVLNAVYQYAIDSNGVIPALIPSTGDCNTVANEICKDGSVCTGFINLHSTLVTSTAKYLVSLPIDPAATSTASGTGYRIFKNPTTNRVTVCAPLAENTVTINASR